jgi:radical SAM superfamily enzyme
MPKNLIEEKYKYFKNLDLESLSVRELSDLDEHYEKKDYGTLSNEYYLKFIGTVLDKLEKNKK